VTKCHGHSTRRRPDGRTAPPNSRAPTDRVGGTMTSSSSAARACLEHLCRALSQLGAGGSGRPLAHNALQSSGSKDNHSGGGQGLTQVCNAHLSERLLPARATASLPLSASLLHSSKELRLAASILEYRGRVTSVVGPRIPRERRAVSPSDGGGPLNSEP